MFEVQYGYLSPAIQRLIGDEIAAIDAEWEKQDNAAQMDSMHQSGYEEWSEPASADNAPSNPGVPSDSIDAYLQAQDDCHDFLDARSSIREQLKENAVRAKQQRSELTQKDHKTER